MKERLPNRIRRWLMETRVMRYKRIIRKYVRKLDSINSYVFMAYSWSADEITDYHVLAERSYPTHHIYGTKVDYYDKGE